MAEDLNLDTLDFIFDYTKEAPETQAHDAQALDAKVVNIFSAASIIIGLAGLSAGARTIDCIAKYLLIGALVFYVATAICTFRHLWVRGLHRSLQADVLWAGYWQDEAAEIKHALVQNISNAYAFNKNVLREKEKTVLIALVTTGVEVVLIGAFVIWSFAL